MADSRFSNLFKGTIGVTGMVDNKHPDPMADAERVPACLLIDTSESMTDYAEQLKAAAIQMVEAIAEHGTAREKVDLEIITFNTTEQISIKIEAQEIYNIVDEVTNKLKPEYRERLEFKCCGGTPTGYALSVAVSELRERYAKLKENNKAPKSPILFFLSDGLPQVHPNDKTEHLQVLENVKAEIRQLVAQNRLSVIAVEVGSICEEPVADWQKVYYPEMHKLMQEVTGLDSNIHVRQAKDVESIEEFFRFTSELLISSSTGMADNLNNINFRENV